MGTITTLRPSSTSSGVGWTPSTGTLHGVTSDDSDATYATWGGSGSALILATPVDAPPAGERRHAVRLRMRGEDGDAWGAVRLASGGLVAGTAAQFTSSPGTITGAWGFGAPADGSTVLSTYVTGQATGVRIEELYIDMDSREAPTFTPQILDGSGSSTTTVSDTAQPVVHANAIDLDSLNARAYRYWITLNGAIVWDSGTLSGTATDQQTTALDNGTYTLHAQIWSTLGSNTAYASDEETLDFIMAVDSIPSPDNPVVSPVDGTPFYELEVCAPYAGDFDDDVAWVEIQRVDCPHGGYLLLNGANLAHASAPNVTAFTDIEITARAGRTDGWLPSGDQIFGAKYNSAGNKRGVIFGLDSPTGLLYLTWSPDGNSGTQTTALSTERPVIDADGNATVRAYLDVDDGAGGWSLTFDQQDEVGDWHQIGDVVTNSGGGTTTVFQAGQNLEAGTRNDGLSERWNGRIYSLQFRDGRAGAILGSPDFTGHNAGTTSITDDQGNTWTIYSPGQLTSDQRLTSVAILGPLETDECATYVDYSLPRSGVGASCDHQPDPCCSYYRARTLGRVDGQLLVSDWSDAYDPGIPNGMIFLWPSTNASIPAGWDRVTALDGKYAKGIATNATQPGATGGAVGHTHTVSTHTHDTSHTHPMTANTSAAVGTLNSSDGAAGTTAILSSHTHTVPANTNSATVVSGTATPSIDTPGNDPDRLIVIYMESNGQPLGVPAGALGLAPDTSLSGWTDYANATGRFLKAAGTGGNAGATLISTIGNHTHAIGAHTHGGTAHTHSATTGTVTSDKSLFAGPNAALWTANHSHPITANSASTASLASGGSGTSGASSLGTNEPPYINLRVKENTSGGDSLPVGLIGIWRGSLGSIPDHWALCDGTAGTPNLIGRYPKGATSSIGTTGGSVNPHTHTSPSHNHTTSGHSHTMTIGSAAAATANVSATNTVTVATGTHTHTHGDTSSTTPTVGNSTSGTLQNTTTEPPYEEVAFVQLIETPTPPPAPDLFCLEWSDNEHLIRTTGEDGPMWAAVGGMFTWDVDRPFTSAVGVMGSRFVTSSEPGGRNLHLTTGVESEQELAELLAVLNRPLVLISPSDAEEVWAAPVSSSVKVIKIDRVRQVTADFIGTGPQPAPQFADVG